MPCMRWVGATTSEDHSFDPEPIVKNTSQIMDKMCRACAFTNCIEADFLFVTEQTVVT